MKLINFYFIILVYSTYSIYKFSKYEFFVFYLISDIYNYGIKISINYEIGII